MELNIEKAIAALNNPVRRDILIWLKDRSNFPPALPEHSDLEGVCVGYIQEKAGLSQSTISNYMGLLKQAGFDGVEIHATHGYLLSSALSPRINTRDDQ